MSGHDDVQCPVCGSLTQRRNVLETVFAGERELAATPSSESSDNDTDCAPYWLCYGMAQYIVEIGEPCERTATGGELCHNTPDCITEWCAPCAARAWLDEQKRLSKPPPQNK